MSTKDYAQDGTPSVAYTGDAPTYPSGVLANINDGNDSSQYTGRVGGTGGTMSGTHEFVVTVSSRFAAEIKFITLVSGSGGIPPSAITSHVLSFQYYDGSWHTLGTLSTSEGKTTRTYNNGGSGFENVSKTRITISWSSIYGGVGPPALAWVECYSLIFNSGYFPATGFKFKTNSDVIEIGRDTSVGSLKLRYYDGASVQGIPLQVPGSRYATNIMIYDGAAVKALTAVIV